MDRGRTEGRRPDLRSGRRAAHRGRQAPGSEDHQRIARSLYLRDGSARTVLLRERVVSQQSHDKYSALVKRLRSRAWEDRQHRVLRAEAADAIEDLLAAPSTVEETGWR